MSGLEITQLDRDILRSVAGEDVNINLPPKVLEDRKYRLRAAGYITFRLPALTNKGTAALNGAE